MSWCRSPWLPLIGTLCFLNLCDFLLHKAKEVFSLYSDSFSILCSLSSSSGIPTMHTCYYVLYCPTIPLNHPHCFFFCSSIWVFFLSCLPNHWFNPLLHLTYFSLLLLYSSFLIFHSSFPAGSYSRFLCPIYADRVPTKFLVAPQNFLVFLTKFLEHSITITLNSMSDKLLASNSISSFSMDSCFFC